MSSCRQRIVWVVCALSIVGSLDIAIANESLTNVKTTTVEGRITFLGTVPPDKSLRVTRDIEYCGSSIQKAIVVRDASSHGVEDVIVSIEGVEQLDTQPQPTAIRLSNQQCQFSPHVQVAYRGSQLHITSIDPVLHNTHIHHQRKTFLNVAVPPNNRAISKRLSRPGMLDVRCDAHKFMEASIHVFDHPYFSLTGKDGLFTIHHVPPGTYQLRIWHRYFGVRTQRIQVSEEKRQTIAVELKK
ncbi:carboxypeptidase regulatory-like domain-containing protein [Nitrospira sp. M1]